MVRRIDDTIFDKDFVKMLSFSWIYYLIIPHIKIGGFI